MNAPQFLTRKREPTMPALPPEERHDAETAQVVDSIIQSRRENARLRERVSALEIDLGFERERVRQLEELLNEAERKRDLYQFHSTAFTVRLQDLFVLAEEQSVTFKRMISEMMKQAKDEAFAPREVQVGKLPEYDGAAEMAKTFAPEQDNAQS